MLENILARAVASHLIDNALLPRNHTEYVGTSRHEDTLPREKHLRNTWTKTHPATT